MVNIWEQGVNRPDIDQLRKLCDILYVTPIQLLGRASYDDKFRS